MSVSGTVTSVSIRLRGLSADGGNGLSTQGIGMLLVAPDGRQFEVMRSPGNGEDELHGVTLNIADNSPAYMPDRKSPWPASSGTINVKPTAFPDSSSPTNYLSPGPGKPAHSSPPVGTDSFASVFSGAIAAGTWKLFVVDHLTGDRIAIEGWDLILTVAGSLTPVTVEVKSSMNPSFTADANSKVTLTATVTSAAVVPSGSVQFREGVNTIAGCVAVRLTPAGPKSSSATCVTTFGTEGSHSVTAVYGGAGNLASSTSAVLNQFARNHTTNPAPNQFCNPGKIDAPGQSNTSPYPSVISIGTDTPRVTNPIGSVTVTLNGLAAPAGLGGTKLVLTGPGSRRFVTLLEGAGFSVNQPAVNVTFSDKAADQVKKNGALGEGSYKPTAYDRAPIPSPPPPAPQIPSAPDVQTLGALNSSGVNGEWALYVFNNGGASSSASIASGWCLNFVPAATK